jgi:hypothetical protein
MRASITLDAGGHSLDGDRGGNDGEKIMVADVEGNQQSHQPNGGRAEAVSNPGNHAAKEKRPASSGSMV